jgi:hypothetical protein
MAMDVHNPPIISSFVIRFVVDDASDKDVTSLSYRGSIRHIQSEEELNFSLWQDAVEFIRRFVPLETENGQSST